jgi:hypothetical protein
MDKLSLPAFDVYLCQVSENVSCAACCGLYNVKDPSLESISDMLSRRSMTFSSVQREMNAVLEFGRKETDLLGDLPMPDFHHCPYIGFIGSDGKRAGCLLHPQGRGNNGVDFRGLSYYGSMTCQKYFCPTHRRLSAKFLKILCDHSDNWYQYGLVITECDFLEFSYKQIINRGGFSLIDSELVYKKGYSQNWKKLLDLKISWPYRAPNRSVANYFFNDPLYQKPTVDYQKSGKNSSRYNRLFQELHSVFHSERELTEAENYIDRLFDNLSE